MHLLSQRKGSTVVELLVVLVIIGILTYLLIPNISGLVSDANNTTANQQTIAIRTAMASWISDPSATLSSRYALWQTIASGSTPNHSQLLSTYLQPYLAPATYTDLMSGTTATQIQSVEMKADSNGYVTVSWAGATSEFTVTYQH